eukprot:c21426_g1_i1 orf=163-642(+)
MAVSLANNVCWFVATAGTKCKTSPSSKPGFKKEAMGARTRNSHFKVRAEAPIEGRDSSSTVAVASTERSEADRLVDGLSFGELCDEFQCISSPAVEATARQLVRDILEMREGNRALGTFAISVKYKDPVRSFTGRDKYKRPSWITNALEKPSVLQKMAD